jgi:predicted nuclease of predicted toxin-antitoxin system
VRLLFDEQLSEELVTALEDLFPESLHVRLLGTGGATDPAVWQLAWSTGVCS